MSILYDDGDVVLHHDDALRLLPTLDLRADLLLCDPPYGVSYVTNHRQDGDPLAVPLQGDEDLNLLRDALPLCDRLLAPSALIYVFAGWQRIGETAEAIDAYWPVKNLLIWDKGQAGTAGDLEGGYGVNFEAIIFAAKGRRTLNGRPRTIIRHDWSGTRDPVHPTVKPVGLMSRLIQHATSQGDLVLDPFTGSGPVLRAAKDLGRRAVGIEIEQSYAMAALQRLGQEAMVFDL